MMNRHRILIVLGLFLSVYSWAPVVAQTYDLRGDWSEAANPNGVWSCNVNDIPLPHVGAWDEPERTCTLPQPAWARAEFPPGAFLPAWFRATCSASDWPVTNGDWLTGDIVVHAATAVEVSNVTWTSPNSGFVTVSGAVWMARNIGRDNEWWIWHNNDRLTGGYIYHGDPYSRSSPCSFAVGSGGPEVLCGIAVSAGDTIRLSLTPFSSWGEFVGVDLRITLIDIPGVSVGVTSPNGGESLLVGAGAMIAWSTAGPVNDSVEIDYSIDSGSTWIPITSSTPNDGSYSWTVPDTPTTEGKVRVTGTDSCTGQPVVGTSGLFSIVTTCEDGDPTTTDYWDQAAGSCMHVSIPVRRPDCADPVGQSSARWKLWTPTGVEDATTENVDCNKPTVLILHGYKDGPTSSWIDVMAQAAWARYAGEVNVLAADVSTPMNPNGFEWNALLHFDLAGFIKSFTGAHTNIPNAAQALANDLECLSCSQAIPLAISHSFGGAMGGLICSHLGGGRIGTLVVTDTPYNRTNLEAAITATCTCVDRVVNIYSPCLTEGGFGSALACSSGNVVNIQKDCSLIGGFEHLALPAQLGEWMSDPSGYFWNQIVPSSGLAPGDWHEYETPWALFPGPGAPWQPPAWLEAILNATEHLIIQGLSEQMQLGSGFTHVGDETQIITGGSAFPSFAYMPFPMPPNSGWLVFEYQVADPASDDIASLSFGDRLLWTHYTATDERGWENGIAYVGDQVGQTKDLVFALYPGSQAAAGDALKIRNVRICDDRIFPGFRGDANLDGVLDGRDVQPFVDVLLGSETNPAKLFAADMDQSGTADDQDIQPFVSAVLGG